MLMFDYTFSQWSVLYKEESTVKIFDTQIMVDN